MSREPTVPLRPLPSPRRFRQYFLSEGATLSIIKNNSFMTDDATPSENLSKYIVFCHKGLYSL